ncbi:MAG: hypothetical protein B7O98_05730 [Zestosphaera tikiterensis]|uniref:tRNA/rRNA methyltransferase SpoU type domain-containing protein n=1 Tax=Zestosphaera tikiterensis TaxID=1973259 RepID=A0A2R7Y3P3_9CREN|nr:MAG: hypothetical protein B7O98_05730 [Zestosphaera tikiterensis]
MLKLRLVIVEPEGRINMGFIFRLAKNFEVDEICIVNPQFHINDPEVIEFSAKGADLIEKAIIKNSLSECLEGVKLSICTTAIADPESDVLRHGVQPEVLPYIIPYDGVLALVFGRESVGLKREELKECDVVSTLETGSEYNVLNLSHAVAIYLYEVKKALINQRVKPRYECSEDVLKAIRRELSNLSIALNDEKGVRALKNLIFRSAPRAAECGALYKLLKSLRYVAEKAKSLNTEYD